METPSLPDGIFYWKLDVKLQTGRTSCFLIVVWKLQLAVDLKEFLFPTFHHCLAQVEVCRILLLLLIWHLDDFKSFLCIPNIHHVEIIVYALTKSSHQSQYLYAMKFNLHDTLRRCFSLSECFSFLLCRVWQKLINSKDTASSGTTLVYPKCRDVFYSVLIAPQVQCVSKKKNAMHLISYFITGSFCFNMF